MIVAVTERPGFFDEVCGIGCHAPFMSISADFAFDIKIIQQHKLTRQLVVIRRDALGKQAKLGVAISLWKIAEDLIVSPILLDDIKTVANRTRLPWLERNRIIRRPRQPNAKVGPQWAASISLRCVAS